MDLVGRADKLCKPGKSKTAAGQAARCGGQPETLSRYGGCSCAPETAGLNQLPQNQPWNTESKFSHSSDQRKRKCGIAGDSEQIANDNVAAFLNSQRTGDWKHRRTNG